MKAGKCRAGAFACEEAIKNGSAQLVLLDEGIAEKSLQNMRSMCSHYKIRCLSTGPCGELGAKTGKPANKVFAVTDKNFAKKLIEIYNEYCKQQPEV